jgi:hypothetical protein
VGLAGEQFAERLAGPPRGSALGSDRADHVLKLVVWLQGALRPIGRGATKKLGDRRAFACRGAAHELIKLWVESNASHQGSVSHDAVDVIRRAIYAKSGRKAQHT